ncbi:hypothetical protein [Rhodopirellula europaea]|uniref:hypothetical protein n=1 Tax=Rhodopirellula europaea TaxID=1263866 RepID=UPI003D292E75
MADTLFRSTMTLLGRTAGVDRLASPDWPRLMACLLADQFDREIASDRTYNGPSLLIERKELPEVKTKPEPRACYGLFHQVRTKSGSLISIGDRTYRFIGYEVPNQTGEPGRCADILALNDEDGLTVFELKLRGNDYGPFRAMLEGLDYLSSFLCSGNLQKLSGEIRQIYGIELMRNVGHEIVVLADPAYFERETQRRLQSDQWDQLKNLVIPSDPSVTIRFAQAELDSDGYFQADVQWV